LRAERAQLLVFESFAHYRLDDCPALYSGRSASSPIVC
jgi:Zn-dependent oligopeptidase